MIRLSKLTDYAIVVLTEMARAQGSGASFSSACLAAKSTVPEPTVAKLMKALTRAGIVTSQRGIAGGYTLSRSAHDISVADIVFAIEGPIAITACVGGPVDSGCQVEHVCGVRGNWDRINTAMVSALASVSLAEMAMPHIPAAFMTDTRAHA